MYKSNIVHIVSIVHVVGIFISYLSMCKSACYSFVFIYSSISHITYKRVSCLDTPCQLTENWNTVPAEMALWVFLRFCRKISGIFVLEVQFMLCWFGRLVPNSCLAREFPFWLSITGWRFYSKGKSYLWGYKSLLLSSVCSQRITEH